MARKKSRRSKARGKSRTKGKRRSTAAKRRNKGQVPLEVLEKRLGKLNRIVKQRGGDAYH